MAGILENQGRIIYLYCIGLCRGNIMIGAQLSRLLWGPNCSEGSFSTSSWKLSVLNAFCCCQRIYGPLVQKFGLSDPVASLLNNAGGIDAAGHMNIANMFALQKQELRGFLWLLQRFHCGLREDQTHQLISRFQGPPYDCVVPELHDDTRALKCLQQASKALVPTMLRTDAHDFKTPCVLCRIHPENISGLCILTDSAKPDCLDYACCIVRIWSIMLAQNLPVWAMRRRLASAER